jgi:hypothetical protein
MQSRGDLMAHVRLVSRMAQTTRADLVAAFEAGTLTQEDWAEMVQTCRGCAWAGRCPEWIDSHAGADSAPQRCLNRFRLKPFQLPAEELEHV